MGDKIGKGDDTGKTSVVTNDLAYLEAGSDAQEAVLEQSARDSIDTIVRNYGSRPWRLLSGYEDKAQGFLSSVLGMELAGGVLVHTREFRGHGGVSGSSIFLKGYRLEQDSEGDNLFTLEAIS